MVLSKEEIMNGINGIIGEATDDNTLEFLENISDTLDSIDSDEDWKTKYEENDKEWRRKYWERFFQKPETEPESDNEETPKTYADLFKTEKE